MINKLAEFISTRSQWLRSCLPFIKACSWSQKLSWVERAYANKDESWMFNERNEQKYKKKNSFLFFFVQINHILNLIFMKTLLLIFPVFSSLSHALTEGIFFLSNKFLALSLSLCKASQDISVQRKTYWVSQRKATRERIPHFHILCDYFLFLSMPFTLSKIQTLTFTLNHHNVFGFNYSWSLRSSRVLCLSIHVYNMKWNSNGFHFIPPQPLQPNEKKETRSKETSNIRIESTQPERKVAISHFYSIFILVRFSEFESSNLLKRITFYKTYGPNSWMKMFY